MWSWNLCKRVLNKTIKTSSKMSRLRFSTSSPYQDNMRNMQSTIDSKEVELFSKHMDDWWDPNGSMQLLHKMNLLRIPFIRDGLVSQKELLPLRDKKILDVGCGGGILSEGLARLGAIVTGIDPSEDLIRIAKEHINVDPKIANNQPQYEHATIEEHAKTKANYYDAVVASEVIEHVNNQKIFVKSCVHALKQGGRIFFTTPNRTKLSRVCVVYLGENVFKYLPQGAHQHDKFITPNELTFLLERNKCHVELTYGVTYNPVTGNWDFSEFQQLMYAIQAVKIS